MIINKKLGYKVWVQTGQSDYVHRFQCVADNHVDYISKSGETLLDQTEGLDNRYFFLQFSIT